MMVQSVRGPISVEELGVTLSHEHAYCDISVHSGKIDNILTDTALAARELTFFRRAGGMSILEMTPIELARDPVALRDISEASGVHIISGVSFYVVETYPQWVKSSSVESLEAVFVKELVEGTMGVRAGFIGELGTHNTTETDPACYELHEAEVKVFQAAARASVRTGVPLFTHAALGRPGHAQLTVLENAGADPRHIVIGHCDAVACDDPEMDLAYYFPMLLRGATCAFDLAGWEELVPDEVRVDRIVRLVDRGYADQIVLGTDTCRRSQLRTNGGRGYEYLLTSFSSRLKASGIDDETLHRLLVDNPARILSSSVSRSGQSPVDVRLDR